MTTERDFDITNFGSVVRIRAVSEAAQTFAAEAFSSVADWQGTPENFTTDWRVARDIVERLQAEENFVLRSL